ncbi:MAG TPA: fructosamine kinase family protein, partial [Solirubrobacteraceae bacterium]|nr:fructosamine kinase family protein [Solirubrobacteraceae bacterium]
MSGIAAALADAGLRAAGVRRVGGGDINDAYAVDLESGGRAFVKTRAGAAPGEYAGEAAGLAWLAEPGALRGPRVLAASDALLALEWIEEGSLAAAGEEELGRGLAAVHAAGAQRFGAVARGAPPETRIGPLLLPNDNCPDWPAFYAERRVRPLLAQARERGALSAEGARAVERVCERLPELAGPPE